MATNITALFDTQYSGSGLEQAKSGFRGYEDAVKGANSVNQSFSTNFEALGKKMERPLGRLAFAGIAEAVIDSSGAMEGASKATQALEQGFHAVGAALLFVNPELGILAIGVAAVVALFVKLSNASAMTADSVKKSVEASQTQSQAYKDSADSLLKSGVIDKQQVGILKDMTKATDDQIKAVIDHIKAERDSAEASIKNNKALIDSGTSGGKGLAARMDLVKAEEKLAAITKTSTGLLDYENQQLNKGADNTKKYSMAVADQYNTLDKLMKLQEQMNKGGASSDQKSAVKQQIADLNALGITYQNATSAIIKNELAVAQMEKELTNTTDQEKKKQLQSEIDWFNKTIDAEQKVADSKKQASADILKGEEQFASSMDSVIKASGKNREKVLNQQLATEITNFANTQAAKLFAAASTDIFINPALAALEFAGGLAVEAAGSAAASALGGGSGVSAPSTPSMSSPRSGGGGSGGYKGNNAQLTVNIQGSSVIDPSTMALINKGLNDLVQQNGYLLTSTQINGVSPMPGSV